MTVISTAAPAAVASLLAHDAAANPPPPKVLPDPPVVAPSKDEAPTVVRKHDGLCFAFYPNGGTLAVQCPAELITEPLGEAILKNPSGRCQFIPFQSGGPGRTGYLDKCPALFSEVAKAGVIPESSNALLYAAAAAREKHDEKPWVDPPQPARLETSAPQEVGCGGCASARTTNAGAWSALGVALALTRRRRRATAR